MAAVVTAALDAMGGDKGAEIVIPGADVVLSRRPDVRFRLYGDRAAIEPLLARYPRVRAAAEFHHTDVAVRMDDRPSQALRRGRWKSSMWLAIDAVKIGAADFAVSAGNTGALMAMAKVCLRPAAEIHRPAIAGLWPTLRGESLLLDCGATIGADARQLFEFAVMGAAMARALFGLARPRVGLLNIGVEEAKGLDDIREAGQMLKDAHLQHLEYAGFVEGDDIGKGTVDVIVTEGFAGNIALKTGEGTARQIATYVRDALNETFFTRLGALLARRAFITLRQKLDTRRMNGGVFLGLNGIVIKSHGGTDAEGFASAIEIGYSIARNGLLAKINQDLTEYRLAHTARDNEFDDASGARVTQLRSVVLGCGGYLPQKVLTNADLTKIVETSDQWIEQRTGIRERHIAATGELTSDLATAAARAALTDARLEASDVDLIILATTTADSTFPAAAVTVQANLGMTNGAAFDLQAVCSGFVYALAVADAMLKSGAARRALVIGAETFSRILDWTDRSTCVLFGDGAGAVVLGAEATADRGILTTHLRSDGRFKDKLYVDGGVSTTGTIGHVRMEGRDVYKHAVTMIADVIDDACRAVAISPATIDWFVPHQANVRIIDATAKRFGIPSEKVIRTIAHHGNTSAASIPLALAEASGDGRIKRGDLLLLESMGGGFTWGSAILRW